MQIECDKCQGQSRHQRRAQAHPGVLRKAPQRSGLLNVLQVDKGGEDVTRRGENIYNSLGI